MEKVRKNVNLKHHSKYSRSIFFVGGALTLAFIVLVVGVYVYDRLRFNAIDNIVIRTTNELTNSSYNNNLALTNVYEDKICYRNVNKYEYKLKESCQYLIKLKTEKESNETNLYNGVISKIINSTQNISTENVLQKQIKEEDFYKYIKEVNSNQNLPKSLLIYSTIIKSPTATICSINIRYDGLEQSQSREKKASSEYLTIEILCSGHVFFSPYEVKTI